jgi:hypothetical protein
MSRVYKSKEHLVVNIPFDVIKTLDIKEGEEVDFFRFQNKYYIFAKKSDIVALVTGVPEQTAQKTQRPSAPEINLSEEEIKLLRKLDTIRYGERTRTKIKSILSQQEKLIMKSLVAKKIVVPFSKSADQEPKYSISDKFYKEFLYGKREGTRKSEPQSQAPAQGQRATAPLKPKWMDKASGGVPTGYISTLESNGYIVLNTEPEAAQLSIELEESIKSGAVVGIRAFNKRFYVGMRTFISKNSIKVIKALEKKPLPVSEISKTTGIDEDGVRTILYIMAENGEAAEIKRDYFSLV